MFGHKKVKQLEDDLAELSADWAKDQHEAKKTINFHKEACKRWAVKYAVLEQEMAQLRNIISDIADMTTSAEWRTSAQSCSQECLTEVGMSDNADSTMWHHPDCPNHTSACCGINEEPPTKKADPELEALLAQEEELQKQFATIRVHEVAREMGLTNTKILEICDKMNIPAKSHSSKITQHEADLIRKHGLEF